MARLASLALATLFVSGCFNDKASEPSRLGLGLEIPEEDLPLGQLLEPPQDLERLENFLRTQSSLVDSCDPNYIDVFEGDLSRQAYLWALRDIFESCSLAVYGSTEVAKNPEVAAHSFPTLLGSVWESWNQTNRLFAALGVPPSSVDVQFLARLQKEAYGEIGSLDYAQREFVVYQSSGNVTDLREAVRTARSSGVTLNLTLRYLNDYPWSTSGCYELPPIDPASLLARLQAINESLVDDMSADSISTIRGGAVSYIPDVEFYAQQGWKPALALVATTTTWYESMAAHYDDERLPTEEEAIYLAHKFMSGNRTLVTDESVMYLDAGFRYAGISDEEIQASVQAIALEDFKSQFGNLDCVAGLEKTG